MGDLGSDNLNRRQFLRLAGLTAAGIGLAACAPAAAPTPAPTKAAVAPTAAGAAPAAAAPTANAADVTAQLYEAAKKEGTVMTYGTGSASDWQQIADAFIKKYPGIKVTAFAGSSESIIDKVLTEARAQKPIADMIYRIQGSDTYALSKEAVLDTYLSPELKNFDEQAYDPQGLFTVVDYIYEVIEYNTKAISAAQAPKGYDDLLKPEFAGKLGLESTAVPWFTGMLRIMGNDKGMAYMKKLAAQKPRLVTGHTTLHKLIVSGEIPVAIYMHHFLPIVDKAAGQPIEWVDPVEVTPCPAVITTLVKKCPHPNAAKLLTDFVLSDEGAKIMVTRAWLPARKGVDLGIVAPVTKVEALLLNDVVAFGKETIDNQKAFTDTFGKA
ncbi:MAG: extracellular solute-binding protein [Dehalococcoidia bacterium]|nr:extracellular solute-binding protein [Dehalococcoidia bacterium]